MKILENEKSYSLWLKIHTIAVACYFVYFSLYAYAPNIFGALYTVGYKLSAVAIIAAFLLFRKLRDGAEFKLVFAFCLWLVLVRFIDGDIAREGMIDRIVNYWIILPYLGFAVLLDWEKRLKAFDVLALIYCIAYTLVGIVCIYGAVHQEIIMDPISGMSICEFHGNRLYVFWKSCNAAGTWFFMACGFCVYLFFRFKKKWMRGLLVFALFVNYLCLALTYSRSSMVSFSVAAGMLAVAVAFEKLPLKTTGRKAVVLVLLMGLCIPLAYKSFSVSSGLITEISTGLMERETTESADAKQLKVEGKPSAAMQLTAGKNPVTAMQLTAEKKAPDQIKKQAEFLNDRGMDSSGRIELWIVGIKLLADDPERLLLGDCDAMDYTNEYIKENNPDSFARWGIRLMHHNAYLEVLMETGLPGFLLMMSFLLLVVIKMIRIYFSRPQKDSLAAKALVITLTGMMLYNFFESALFHIYDLRTVIFCVLCGYMLAFYKDISRKAAEE